MLRSYQDKPSTPDSFGGEFARLVRFSSLSTLLQTHRTHILSYEGVVNQYKHQYLMQTPEISEKRATLVLPIIRPFTQTQTEQLQIVFQLQK